MVQIFGFLKQLKELLPAGYTNPASPNGEFTRKKILWMFGLILIKSYRVLLNRGLDYPADIYLEGSDQYRDGFNSSLICGVAVHGKSPYKRCIMDLC